MSGSEALESGASENCDRPLAVTDDGERPSEPNGRRNSRLTLLLGFIGAFIGALSAFLIVGHYGFQVPRSLSPFEDLPAELGTITNPFVVNHSGVYQKVQSSSRLNPSPGSDYLFFVWFKLRKVPNEGEVFGLVGKFDSQSRNRPGYAVSLQGAPDGVRPRVYWNDAEGRGRWFSFSSSHIRRNQWYLMVVSFSSDTFLSVHVAHPEAGEKAVLLGGYRIEPQVFPASQADVVVGAFGASRFRGQVGPFGVLSGQGLSDDLKRHIEALESSFSDAIPAQAPKEFIQLWASPARDLGPHGLVISQGIAPIQGVKPQDVGDDTGVGGGAGKSPPRKKVKKKSLARKRIK